eukprot:g62326.t1
MMNKRASQKPERNKLRLELEKKLKGKKQSCQLNPKFGTESPRATVCPDEELWLHESVFRAIPTSNEQGGQRYLVLPCVLLKIEFTSFVTKL